MGEYENYLIVERDDLQLNFFLFVGLEPKTNYGHVYLRTDEVDALYRWLRAQDVPINPNGALSIKR